MDELIQKYIQNKLEQSHYEKFLYVLGKGKRVRPKLMKMICTKYGKNFHSILSAAVAVEIMHCTSLVHDDIVDEETSRRGALPFYKKYGTNSAVLFGDFFGALSIEIFSSEYPKAIYMEFIKTFKDMIEGQLMELENKVIDFNSYLKYIEKKTASLFSLCVKVPYLYYKLEDKRILESGREYGLLFQIADDLSSNEEEKCNILNFMSKEEAIAICREKMRRISKMGVIDLVKLPLNFSIADKALSGILS